MSVPVKIIVNSFTSEYTNAPNPIGAFTYPIADVNLSITYNGLTGIPVNSGNYNVSIDVADTGYYAEQAVTGVYSIVGDLHWRTIGLDWGTSMATANSPEFAYATSGLLGVQKLVAANDFSVALMSDNSIVTWGTGNLYGQQSIPDVGNYIKDIEVSDNTTYIIDWSGNVTGCGYLFNTLGNGYSGFRPKLTGISSLSAAENYVVAIPLDRNKGLTGWSDPAKVIFNYREKFNLNNVSQICCTDFACIALQSGRGVAWGLDYFGQLPFGSGSGNSNIKKISCSDTSTVLLYENKTVSGLGVFIDTNEQFIDYYIPDSSIQGHVLDISASNTQTLFILDTYFAPPVLPPPECVGTVYAQ